MEFGRGEVVEWLIEDKETLVLHRPEAPARKLKKKLPRPFSRRSKTSSTTAGTPSAKSGVGSGEDGSS
jgi:hypothetical protein